LNDRDGKNGEKDENLIHNVDFYGNEMKERELKKM
jgi:hypothetical protein